MYAPWLIFGTFGLIGFIALHILYTKKLISKEHESLCKDTKHL